MMINNHNILNEQQNEIEALRETLKECVEVLCSYCINNHYGINNGAPCDQCKWHN